MKMIECEEEKMLLYCDEAKHILIARKANILEFLRNNDEVTKKLVSLTKDTYGTLKQYNFFIQHKNVADIISTILISHPDNELKKKFVTHVLKEQTDCDINDCLGVLSRIVTGITFEC